MKKYDEDIPEGHPSQEKRPLRAKDARLRRYGFTINARPKTGPVLWEKAGKVYTEAQAQAMCKDELAQVEQVKR